MQKVSKIINRVFLCVWIAFFLYAGVGFLKDYYQFSVLPDVFVYKYILYAWMLGCSALTFVKTRYGLSFIWFCFIAFLIVHNTDGTPEQKFYWKVSNCYEEHWCDDLIKDGYLKIENGEYIWLKEFRIK